MLSINKITAESTSVLNIKTPQLFLGVFEDGDIHDNISKLNASLNSIITNAVKIESFTGKSGKSVTIYANDEIGRITLIGLGKKSKLTTDESRSIGAKLTNIANSSKLDTFAVDSASFDLHDEFTQALTEGIALGSYQFLDYKSEDKNKFTVSTVQILGDVDEYLIKSGFDIASGVSVARDMGNHPANILTPTYMAEYAEDIAKKGNMNFKVIDESKFQEMGMGAFYGVAMGSAEPAKMIIAEYNGASSDEKPFALVGKGLTFDSGGISLKPGAKMDEMKFDMCGSATVLGVMETVSQLKPKLNIIFAIGATENMPGSKAQRPGDIVTAYNGKTIEVLNTDAEGRLVLADVLSYVVDKYQPSAMMDFATLTGAVLVALGDQASGVMGNNQEFIDEIKSSSEITAEKVWQLPLWDSYCKDIKSKIADIKNLGRNRLAGTITAGAFLQEFVGDTPWCHMDIAGTAWGPTTPGYQPKTGATGVAVRLVYNLIENRSK